MKIATGRKSLLLCVTLLSSVFGASAFAAPTPVEIIQSIPSETNLAVPGLRLARDVWPMMVSEAKTSIDIAQMYISSETGRSMEPVVRALEAAGNRGIKIRFLLGANMQDNDKLTLARLKAIPNLTLALYDLKKVTGGILHAKYWIIDGRRFFVGSQNFDWRALEEIHETGVLVESKALSLRLHTVFEHDWKFATRGVWDQDAVPSNSKAPTDVELLVSPERLNPRGVTTAIPKILSMIAKAKTSVQVALLDYSTKSYSSGKVWLELDDALRAAAARGVKVELLVSHWNTTKSGIGSIKELAKVPGIEVRISFVPPLSTGHMPYARVIHSKTMIVDGKSYMVGTSNWSRGYFYDTRDIEVVMNRPDLAAIGGKIFSAVWTAPYTEAVDINRNYPEPRKGE